MAGKFDHLMPVQVGDIVKEIRAIKKTLIRVGSTAQNAAALAHRAIPSAETVNVVKDGQTFLTSSWADRLSTTIQLPEGTRTLIITGAYVSCGTTMSDAGGGLIGTYLNVLTHGGPNAEYTFQVAPPITNGTSGAVPVSASSFGGSQMQGWLLNYGVTSIELVAGGYRIGNAQANSDNVHISAAMLFYR